VSERSCHLFTILGPAGVGKSRLAAEFLASLDDALIVRGRCLPYGEGITYWPVVEVLKQLPEGDVDELAAGAIRGLLGEETVVSSSEEIAWAFRKQLEAVAAERPLACVFDDAHWGEETFLDLVEHVADLSRDAPILLLCMARPELRDRRPGWGGGKVNATTVLLEPLRPDETERLIESLAHLDEGLRARIQEAAEGNPLFVEEMVALAQESGDTNVTVPPTIQALLAARLDQLELHEREVLQCGSVEGRIFHRGAVQALAPEEPQVMARLTALVRKELVRPDKPQLPGEDAFRFRHLLIRDAAYDALPKATRAELHERFAAWLEEHGADLVELDEILGYHLEQAYRYRLEMGTDDPALGRRAGERLAAAGHRAEMRRDVVAWANLLGRAVELTPPDQRQVALELDLGDALFSSGRPREAETLLAETETRAASGGDRAGELVAALARVRVLLHLDPEGVTEQLLALAQEAIPVLSGAGDDLGLVRAWAAIGWVEHQACRFGPRTAAFEQALVHARRAREERLVGDISITLAVGYALGPTPVEDALRFYETELSAVQQLSLVKGMQAMLRAMLGRFDDARALVEQARERAEELGEDTWLALIGESAWYVEMWAGNVEAAARAVQDSCERLEAMGEKGWQSTFAARLARSLALLGRDDEAEHWARQGEELGASDDVMTQMLCRQARGRVRARRGDLEDGERLVRDAVALAEQTDMPNERADARMDLAEVLALAGRRSEAAVEVEKALVLYEQKGNVAMAGQARARLESLI
jgi:tetratricopeptide (TPR) repeat protein